MSKICPKCGEPLKYRGYSSCGTEACRERCIRNDELARVVAFIKSQNNLWELPLRPETLIEMLERKEHRK